MATWVQSLGHIWEEWTGSCKPPTPAHTAGALAHEIYLFIHIFICAFLFVCLFIWTQWGGAMSETQTWSLLPSQAIMSNLQPTGHAHPKVAVRVAQERIINSVKTLWDYFLCVLPCDSVVWSWVWTLQMTMSCWMSKGWTGLKDQVLKFSLRFISLIYICVVCMCAWVSLCSPHACGYPRRSEGIWSPGSGGIGSCQPHNVGAGNWP